MPTQTQTGDDAPTSADIDAMVDALDIRHTTVHHELARGAENGEVTDVHQGTGSAWGVFFDGDTAAKANIVRYLDEAGLVIQTVHFENAGFFVVQQDGGD